MKLQAEATKHVVQHPAWDHGPTTSSVMSTSGRPHGQTHTKSLRAD